jgi:hypothetical protein
VPGERELERIDLRQLLAVLRLVLGQMLRPGRDVSTGSKGRPLLQLAFSMGLLGALFIPNAWRTANLESYVVLLFGMVLLLVALLVLPETHEARQRNIEVLHSRPVPQRTLVVARVLTLTVMTSLISGVLGLTALSAVVWHFGASVWRMLGLLLALQLGTFAIAGLWVSGYNIALRWISVTTWRRVSQSLLMLLMFAVMMGNVVFPPAHGDRPLGLERMWIFEVLPSTWFARLALPGLGLREMAECLAAVVLLSTAVALLLSARVARRYGQLLEQQAYGSQGEARSGWVVGALTTLSRLPLVRAWLHSGPVLGMASAGLTLTKREEIARLKTLSMRVVVAAFFAMGMLGFGRDLAFFMVTYAVWWTTMDGMDVLRQSAHAGASWILYKAPLRGRDVLRAIEVAVVVRSVAFPLLLFAILATQAFPLRLSLLFVAGMAVLVRLVMVGDVIARPVLPLSREQSSLQSVVGMLLGMGLGLASTVAGAILVVLDGAFGWVAPIIGWLAVAGLVVVLMLARLWAAARLEAVECPH